MVFSPTVEVDVDALHELQHQVSGTVLTPDSADYDQLRQVWHLGFDQHPALILVAQDAADIVAAVRFAHEAGLGVAVKSTGHGQPYPADGQLLIVTSQMNHVEVDPEARTAQVEAGAIWEQVLEKSTPHGLAPLLGSSPHVGVVGYSLGGGIGWLARRYGLAADSVRWVELVTAEGVLIRASATRNSELFWGLRGGTGNFGVITALGIDLYPVATVYGGLLTYPATSAAEVAETLRFYRDWLKTVPEELTSSVNIFKFPSIPQVPEGLRGKIQIFMRAVYAGDEAEGAALIRHWLDWQTPSENNFRQLPFSEIGTVSNDPVNPSPTYPTNEMLNDLSDEAIEIIARYTTNPASPMAFNELRHAGGAISRADASQNAIGNRNAQFYYTFGGLAFTPEHRAAIDAYRHDYKDELRPYLDGGTYFNFLKGGEARKRIQDAYRPETTQRLLALKAKYDPDNMFRFGYPLTAAES
jgi:FAD/FMN-containing dehydrogenase